MKLPELRALLKENKIKGYSYYNKPQLIALLNSKGLLSEVLPEEIPKPPTRLLRPIIKEIDPSYEHLRKIRNQPKSVDITDNETGEVTRYPSIYKAAQAFMTCPRMITYYNEKTFKNRYLIKVL